jgi:hypothetical protein
LPPDTRRCSWCGQGAQPPASHSAKPTVSSPAATRPTPEGTLHGIVLPTAPAQNSVQIQALSPATGAAMQIRTFDPGVASLALNSSRATAPS